MVIWNGHWTYRDTDKYRVFFRMLINIVSFFFNWYLSDIYQISVFFGPINIVFFLPINIVFFGPINIKYQKVAKKGPISSTNKYIQYYYYTYIFKSYNRVEYKKYIIMWLYLIIFSFWKISDISDICSFFRYYLKKIIRYYLKKKLSDI